jgi:hypothetical protein
MIRVLCRIACDPPSLAPLMAHKKAAFSTGKGKKHISKGGLEAIRT